jgi:hypothetical protein
MVLEQIHRIGTNERYCEYCGETYHVKHKAYRTKWHGCQESIAAREEIQKQKQKDYDRTKRVRTKGPKPRHFTKDKRLFVKDGHGTPLYKCQSRVSENCWGVSYNRFNCPACLERLEQDPNVVTDILGHDVDGSFFD